MPRFRYPLDALLKQYEWEIDALKVELLSLNQALNAKKQELQQITQVVRDAEQQIMDMCRENAIIALDRKALVETYLRDQRQCRFAKQQEFEQAQSLADGVFEQLKKKKQSQRAIEKHRERKHSEFVADGIRREVLEADELWLAKVVAAK